MIAFDSNAIWEFAADPPTATVLGAGDELAVLVAIRVDLVLVESVVIFGRALSLCPQTGQVSVDAP